MDVLDRQVVIDELTKSMIDAGLTSHEIREFLIDEANRVESEIEEGEFS